MSDLAKLPDAALVYSAKLLERKAAALKMSSTAAGVALYQQMQDRLAAVRGEIQRRAAI